MLRCARHLFSKPTAARRRASQAALQVSAFNMASPKQKSVRPLDILSRFAVMRLSFNTENLSELLDKSLPSTANVLTIDNTTKSAFNDISSILRCVILYNHQYIHREEGPWVRHPLLVIVRTSLEKDDADTTEFVLMSALQQRDHLKDATAIVLDGRLSSLVGSLLSDKNGNGTVVKVEETVLAAVEAATENASATANVGTGEAEKPALKDDPPVEEKKCDKVEEGGKEKGKGKSGANGNGEEKEEKKEDKKKNKKEGVKETKIKVEEEEEPSTTKKNPGSNSAKKATNIQSKKHLHSEPKVGGNEAEGKGAAVSTSLSYRPPPGAVKNRSSPGAETQRDTRESLQRMFRSSLAAPFQPPQQVERKLFLGYVDKVRLTDLLNLPLYGGGEVYVLYYRLTGAGACRTPLITITDILEEVCRKKSGKTTKNINVLSTNRVPLLLLLSASFLVGEDANLLSQEYQKELEARLSMLADVNVIVAPSCYTEKNVLFALRSAGISVDSNVGAQGQDDISLDSNLLRRCERTAASLPEDALRSVVTGALEEVALRHEKSTDHLVSTLNKLVEYWSRERVIELIEGLQSEREVLLDATKEFENVQRQLRSAQDALKALQHDVRSIDGKIGNLKDGADAPSVDVSALAESIGGLERRLAKSVSTMPSKQQIALDVREELESMQQTLQRNFDLSLGNKLKDINMEQQRNLTQALKQCTPSDEKEQQQQLAMQILEELPQRIQTAMEKALQSLNQNSDEKTAKVLIEQQKMVETQVSTLCDAVYKAVDEGQRRVERTVVDLLQVTTNNKNADTVESNTDAADAGVREEKEEAKST